MTRWLRRAVVWGAVGLMIVAGIGWMLPAGHVVSRSRVIGAPPSAVYARIADPDQPFSGTWTFDLTAEGRGTRVSLTERGEVHNPIFRFLSRYAFSQEATVESCLAALADSLNPR